MRESVGSGGSENVRTICCGDFDSDALAAGFELTRVAWAPAAGAKTARQATAIRDATAAVANARAVRARPIAV